MLKHFGKVKPTILFKDVSTRVLAKVGRSSVQICRTWVSGESFVPMAPGRLLVQHPPSTKSSHFVERVSVGEHTVITFTLSRQLQLFSVHQGTFLFCKCVHLLPIPKAFHASRRLCHAEILDGTAFHVVFLLSEVSYMLRTAAA